MKIAGRLMVKRLGGGISFVRLQDRSGQIQLMIKRDRLGEELYGEFKKWDLGDVIAARGEVVKSKTGELSVDVAELKLLAKSLRPLPEKWHGIADAEMKLRQRYVDLIMSEETREVFRRRSVLTRFIRSYFDALDFTEVETPMMQPIPGGATARPFVTHHNALDATLYLRIAPELYLKRLVVGGFERVYELNRVFRNEGLSTRHNPEFTMLELYQAYAVPRDLMTLTENLIRGAAQALTGGTEVEYQGQRFDLGAKFDEITVEAALERAVPALEGPRARSRRARRGLRRARHGSAPRRRRRQAPVRAVREGRRSHAARARVRHAVSGRGLAARALQRRRSVRDGPLRALHRRARARERLRRAQRSRGAGGAFPRAGRSEGGGRRGSDVLRRRLHPRARVRHAACGGLRVWASIGSRCC